MRCRGKLGRDASGTSTALIAGTVATRKARGFVYPRVACWGNGWNPPPEAEFGDDMEATRELSWMCQSVMSGVVVGEKFG
jgi:hypothetical protein